MDLISTKTLLTLKDLLNHKNNMFDVVVIGAGVAGMTAALNDRRGGQTVLLLEPETIAGRMDVQPRVLITSSMDDT